MDVRSQQQPLPNRYNPEPCFSIRLTGARYSNVLQNELRPAVHRERGNLSEIFLVLHDNSRVHTAVQFRETILELIFGILNQPEYSPNSATSDFHLFGPLKGPTGGRPLADGDEAKKSLCTAGQSASGRRETV
jgi:hypothetical protein